MKLHLYIGISMIQLVLQVHHAIHQLPYALLSYGAPKLDCGTVHYLALADQDC